MHVKTHKLSNPHLVGSPINIVDGVEATVRLRATQDMAVDERGLIHGGFIFGLADYAAMLAVNDPNVVLAGSKVRFLAPVKVGDEMIAEAKVVGEEGRKNSVFVKVFVEDREVLEGNFICLVLDRHVLE